MKTQFDGKVRMVALENLKAMCKRINGYCHRFEVSKVSRSRVHVTYSNPNEYGTEFPMTAVFVAVPNQFDNEGDNPHVLLDTMCMLRVMHDNWGGEGWQAFQQLLDCPHLWRDPNDDEWKTREEINREILNLDDRVQIVAPGNERDAQQGTITSFTDKGCKVIFSEGTVIEYGLDMLQKVR